MADLNSSIWGPLDRFVEKNSDTTERIANFNSDVIVPHLPKEFLAAAIAFGLADRCDNEAVYDGKEVHEAAEILYEGTDTIDSDNSYVITEDDLSM